MRAKRAAVLRPLPGFDWSRVVWGAADAVQSEICSYCRNRIPEDDVPLRMWADDGRAAQFCDHCMETWWGMTSFKAEDDDAPIE